MWFLRSWLMSMAIWAAVPVAAHEYWVEPLEFTVPVGEKMQAYLKVGQDFGGTTFPFIPARFTDFRVHVDGRGEDYVGRVGDSPALQMEAVREGLNIITYQSRPDRLIFGKEGLLETYLKAEGLEDVLEAHRADGLAETGFSERYTRNAKALVQVGAKSGVDAAIGMPFELVVKGSPYEGEGMVGVHLLWRGEPMADWPINVFTKRDSVKQTRVYTDASGFAQVEFPADAKVMMNAVYIERTKPGTKEFYESWWASLTFGR